MAVVGHLLEWQLVWPGRVAGRRITNQSLSLIPVLRDIKKKPQHSTGRDWVQHRKGTFRAKPKQKQSTGDIIKKKP